MARIVILVALLLHAVQAPVTPPAPIELRFHHVHTRAADLTELLRSLRGRADESPVILQGIGVGLRFGREFILIERPTRDTVEVQDQQSVATSYAALTAWLTSNGFGIAPVSPGPVALTAMAGEIEHLAFATSRFDEAVRILERAGKHPVRKTDVSAVFDSFEIVRDPELPDRFYCPMHPDVRTAVEGHCPICKMQLVPIPPPRLASYRMNVTPSVRAGGGITGLSLEISEGDPARRVTTFTTVHERPMHLFLVSRDLQSFSHVHPDRLPDGRFELVHDFRADEYLFVADFLPADGTPQTLQRLMVTPRSRPALSAPEPPAPSSIAVAGGIRAILESSGVEPGKEAALRFRLTDAVTGAPVTDLEPYLAAPAHAFTVSADLTFAEHGHPTSDAFDSGTIELELTAPSASTYKIWLQVQRRGVVVTLPFVIQVL